MKWEIVFYQLKRGNFPVKDFIEAQNPQVVAKITQYLILLETCGPYLKPPYMRKLQKSLYELRIHSKIAIRILYSKRDNAFILLHGFIKKNQKNPKLELSLWL